MVFLTETGRFKIYFVNIEYYFDDLVSYCYICGLLTCQPMKNPSHFRYTRNMRLGIFSVIVSILAISCADNEVRKITLSEIDADLNGARYHIIRIPENNGPYSSLPDSFTQVHITSQRSYDSLLISTIANDTVSKHYYIDMLKETSDNKYLANIFDERGISFKNLHTGNSIEWRDRRVICVGDIYSSEWRLLPYYIYKFIEQKDQKREYPAFELEEVISTYSYIEDGQEREGISIRTGGYTYSYNDKGYMYSTIFLLAAASLWTGDPGLKVMAERFMDLAETIYVNEERANGYECEKEIVRERFRGTEWQRLYTPGNTGIMPTDGISLMALGGSSLAMRQLEDIFRNSNRIGELALYHYCHARLFDKTDAYLDAYRCLIEQYPELTAEKNKPAMRMLAIGIRNGNERCREIMDSIMNSIKDK